MKPIKIVEKNREAIEAALAAVNGKACAFTITEFGQVQHIANNAETKLAYSGIAKARRRGAVAEFKPAGPVAKSYRFSSISTLIAIERRPSGWFLVGAKTAHVWPREATWMHIRITPEQRDEITRHALTGYVVMDGAE